MCLIVCLHDVHFHCFCAATRLVVVLRDGITGTERGQPAGQVKATEGRVDQVVQYSTVPLNTDVISTLDQHQWGLLLLYID